MAAIVRERFGCSLVKFFTKSGYTDGRYRTRGGWLCARGPSYGLVYGSGTMAKKQAGFSFKRSAESLQDNVRRAGPAAGASYTLIGAIVLLGGLGYGIDQWQGTAPWGLFVGLLLGLVVGFYELAKVVWHR
jgi:F0F1-type ATP synthase assembly protein I